MGINRSIVALLSWMMSLVILAASCFPWISRDENVLRTAGTVGVIFLLPMGLLFRSDYFAQLIKSTPKRSMPNGLLLFSRLLIGYAISCCVFFVAYWALNGTISVYGNVMLAPFGVFSFYMGRWILFSS